MSVDNFWNMPPAAPERGPKDGPLLVPKAGGDRVEYTRASGLCSHIKNLTHIHTWEMRYLAIAMGQNPDLAALAAAETYSTGPETEFFNSEENRAKTQSGKRVDQIIERALDRRRIHEKADRGTTFHALTEPDAPTGPLIPESLQVPLQEFEEVNRRECIESLGVEMFAANDVTRTAGTFDRAVKIHGHPLFGDKIVISDIKTGRFDPVSWAVQISTYAYGDRYDTDTDQRIPWPGEVDLEHALVWQVDCKDYASVGRPEPKAGRIKLWVVNIRIGWELAQLAAKVRDLTEDKKEMAEKYRSPDFEERLALSNTREALTALWHSLEDGDALRAAVEEKGKAL